MEKDYINKGKKHLQQRTHGATSGKKGLNDAMAYDRKSFQIEKEETAMMRKAYEKTGIQRTRDVIKLKKQITSTKKAEGVQPFSLNSQGGRREREI